MEIIINGETRQVEDNVKLKRLIQEFGLDIRKVAIERNLEIVPKSAYAETALKPGDRIEIVEFVGGG